MRSFSKIHSFQVRLLLSFFIVLIITLLSAPSLKAKRIKVEGLPVHLEKQLARDVLEFNAIYEKNEELEKQNKWSEANYYIDLRKEKIGRSMAFTDDGNAALVENELRKINQEKGVPYYVVILSVQPHKKVMLVANQGELDEYKRLAKSLYDKYYQSFKKSINILDSTQKCVLYSVNTNLTLLGLKDLKANNYTEYFLGEDNLKKENIEQFWYSNKHLSHQTRWAVSYGDNVFFGPEYYRMIREAHHDVKSLWEQASDDIKNLYGGTHQAYTNSGNSQERKVHRGKTLLHKIRVCRKMTEYFESDGTAVFNLRDIFINRFLKNIAVSDQSNSYYVFTPHEIAYQYRSFDFKQARPDWTKQDFEPKGFAANEGSADERFYETSIKQNFGDINLTNSIAIDHKNPFYQEFLDEGYVEVGFNYYHDKSKKAISFKLESAEHLREFLKKTGFEELGLLLEKEYIDLAISRIHPYVESGQKSKHNEVKELIEFVDINNLDKVDFETRMSVMEHLFDYTWLEERIGAWAGYGYSENILLKMIQGIKSPQEVDKFFDALLNRSFNGKPWFLQLINEYSDIQAFITDENYPLLAKEIIRMSISNIERFGSIQKINDLITSDNAKFSTYTIGRVNNKEYLDFISKIDENGFVNIARKGTIINNRNISKVADSWDKNSVKFHPFKDIVLVKAMEDIKSFNFKKDETYQVPAFILYFYNDSYQNKENGILVEAAVDVASLAMGVGALRGGASILTKALLIEDVLVTAANWSITISLELDVIENNEDVEYVKKWLTYIDLIGVGVTDVPTLIKNIGKGGASTFRRIRGNIPANASIDAELAVLEQIAKKIDSGTDGLGYISSIGKSIDQVPAPTGYSYYTRNEKTWIRRLDASDLNTPKLTVKDGKIIYAEGDWLKVSDDALDLTGSVSRFDLEDLLKNGATFENNAGNGFVDVLIHGDGGDFLINGKIIGGNDLPKALANYNGKLRLLSCSNLESAQDLAVRLGKEVVATPGIVRIHTDGLMSVAPNKGSPTDWITCKADGTKAKLNTKSQETTKPNEYVELGKNPRSTLGSKADELLDITKVDKNLKINIYGEGEALPSFHDVATNAKYAEGRVVTSNLKDGSVSDFFIRDSPIDNVSEINRLAGQDAKITLMNPDKATLDKQVKALQESFGNHVSIEFQRYDVPKSYQVNVDGHGKYTINVETNIARVKVSRTGFKSATKNLVDYGGKQVPVYRGGSNFKLKPNEYKVNKETGLVKPTHGLSLDVDPNTVSKFGGAYKIDFIPEELTIIQRGQRLEHFEIVPVKEMTVEKFQSLLDQIRVSLQE